MPHTPGPWRTDDRHIYAGGSPDGSADLVVASCNDKAGFPTSPYPSMSEAVANARLIAAAPTLLEACQAAIRYDASILGRASRGEVDLLDGGGGVATGDDLDALYDDWITKARTAIQQAESD